jgi:hypothetical protein
LFYLLVFLSVLMLFACSNKSSKRVHFQDQPGNWQVQKILFSIIWRNFSMDVVSKFYKDFILGLIFCVSENYFCFNFTNWLLSGSWWVTVGYWPNASDKSIYKHQLHRYLVVLMCLFNLKPCSRPNTCSFYVLSLKC